MNSETACARCPTLSYAVLGSERENYPNLRFISVRRSRM
jgi:hypothetical protein